MTSAQQHLKIGIIVIVIAVLGVLPLKAVAITPLTVRIADKPGVFITEFQTNGDSAAHEFIELYNSTDRDIVFSDPLVPATEQWKLQFFNSTAVKAGTPVWNTAATNSNSITLTGTISAHDYFLVSSNGYDPAGTVADQSYSPSSSHLMTDTGGALQLISQPVVADPTSIIAHDRVMWLAQASGVPLPTGVLASPAPGSSQQRLDNEDSEYTDSSQQISPFILRANITPLAAWLPIVEGSEDDAADPTQAGEDISLTAAGVASNNGLLLPVVNELLPNPASPLTDAADEYIELHNPNTVPFDLLGFSLEVGTTTLHTYTFTNSYELPAGGFVSFKSALTHLSLSNSGGQARLKNPVDEVISETAAYGTAAAGQSWALKDDVWRWTTTATPNAENNISEPAIGAASAAAIAKSTKTAATKTTSAKSATAKAKTTVKKATAKKASVKKVAKKKVKKPPVAKLATVATVKPKPPIHNGILVAVALVAVLYGLYEYRQDIANKFHERRANRGSRKQDRNLPEWR